MKPGFLYERFARTEVPCGVDGGRLAIVVFKRSRAHAFESALGFFSPFSLRSAEDQNKWLEEEKKRREEHQKRMEQIRQDGERSRQEFQQRMEQLQRERAEQAALAEHARQERAKKGLELKEQEYRKRREETIERIHNHLDSLSVPEPEAPVSHPIPDGRRAGYVYLLKSPTGWWKIGHAADPNDRLKVFSIKLPFEVEYEHLIPCQDRVAAEKELHQRFATKRGSGEWFQLSQDDVEMIKAIEHL